MRKFIFSSLISILLCPSLIFSEVKPHHGVQSLRQNLFSNNLKSWQKLSLAKGKITVLLPKISEPSIRELSHAGVNFTLTEYQAEENGIKYEVACVGEMPERLVTPEAITFLLSSAPRNLLESAKQAGKVGLVLTDEKEISLQGYKGKQFAFRSAEETILAKGYVIEHYFITLVVTYPNKTDVEKATNFLESISISQ